MDIRPLRRFYLAVNEIGTVWQPKPGMVAKCSVWRSSSDEAEEALDLIWAFLSEPKREQANRVIEKVDLSKLQFPLKHKRTK